jgi:hypothetical protein
MHRVLEHQPPYGAKYNEEVLTVEDSLGNTLLRAYVDISDIDDLVKMPLVDILNDERARPYSLAIHREEFMGHAIWAFCRLWEGSEPEFYVGIDDEVAMKKYDNMRDAMETIQARKMEIINSGVEDYLGVVHGGI